MNADLIIRLLQLYHDAPNEGALIHEDYTFDKNGVSYLLNQTIRQLWLPKEHYLVSVKAQDLWDRITDGDIRDYFYRDRVKVKCDSKLPYYIGNAKKPSEYWTYKKGKTFSYRSVFHDEHIVPVDTIVKELLNLETITPETVKSVLDKIYICKMLKEEDRSGGENGNCQIPKYKRNSDDYKAIIEKYYHPNGIYICGEEMEDIKNEPTESR